jgi:hypothetical protein
MEKDCPKCGLVNPPAATRCDCGYDFASGRMKQSYLVPNLNWQSIGRRNMLYGALWFVGGLAVTVGSFFFAPPNGVFVVAWGAILFGALQFIRGVFQYGRMR